MHKQVSSLLANGGSPGQLARYARALARAGVNIRAIGGTEWNHQGAVAVLVDDSIDENELVTLLGEEFPSRVMYCAEAVLPDERGSLAAAAERITDKLNILSVLVADTHLGVGLVSFGFETEAEAEQARANLRDYAVQEPHDLTRAWAEHDAWDRSNPNPPDARHPSP
jgi:hypothetical protein